MAVTYPTEYKAKFENVTVLGTDHFQSTAHDLIRDTIEDEAPDVIAFEQDPERIAAVQLNFDEYDRIIDPLVVLEEALTTHTDLALIDKDWDDIYAEYTEEEKNEILQDAADNCGFDTDTPVTERTRDELREWNNEVNRIDSNFYNKFILQRDIYMAQKVAYLSNEYDSVLVIIGHGHMESVAEMANDILTGDDAGFVPTKPPTFTPEQLGDVIVERGVARKHFRETAPVSLSDDQFNQYFEMKRENYREVAENILKESPTNA